jgi:hypothetical protein
MGPIEALVSAQISLVGLLAPFRGPTTSDATSAAALSMDIWPLLLLSLVALAAFASVVAAHHARARAGAVQAVFFIHRDGRLVRHYARADIVVDPVIFSGMLIALEAFVHDSVAEGSGPLQELKFSGRSFVLERGGALLAVAVCKGAAPPDLRPRLRDCIGGIEAGEGHRLRHWDGSQVEFPETVDASVLTLVRPGLLAGAAT